MLFFYVNITCRSSRPYISVKKMFIKNLTKFTGKQLCQSLFFNKVAACRVSFLIKLQPATLLKKKFWHRCFPVNFAKILRTPFLTDHLRWLLLYLVYTHLSLIPASFIFSIKLCESLSNLFSSGLETSDSLVNETNFLSFLSLFLYSFSAIAWQSVQTVSV